MKMMISVVKWATYCLIFFASLTFNSCSEEETTLDREVFLGEFRSFSDSCVNATYQITIAESGQNHSKIVIDNLYGLQNLSVTAVVSANSFNIDPVQLNGQLISGQGVLNGNNLTINYSVDEGGTTQDCEAIYDRL